MTKQLNVALRFGLDQQVRVAAAQRGCRPRDVIEDALLAAGFRRVDAERLSSDAQGATSGEALEAEGDGPLRAENPADAETAGSIPVSPLERACPECAGRIATAAGPGGTLTYCTECSWRA